MIEIRYWNDEVGYLVATDVRGLRDDGTFECDGVVRLPELDADGALGYGVVDTEGTATLRFTAASIEFT